MSEQDNDEWVNDEVVQVEITDELDLHTFAPKDVKELVGDYVEACVERGFDQVRIVHGKGIGNLRRIVHAVLERHPDVLDYRLAEGARGSWGATIADLRGGDPRK